MLSLLMIRGLLYFRGVSKRAQKQTCQYLASNEPGCEQTTTHRYYTKESTLELHNCVDGGLLPYLRGVVSGRRMA